MLDNTTVRAKDLMTRDVAVVHPDSPLRQVVKLMAERHLSGLPVTDDSGALIGMISEGDLVRWHEDFPEREATWLDMLGQGFELAPAFVEALRAAHHTVRHAMRPGPVICVDEDTPAREIADIMASRSIKRVPVLRDGKMVGLVARADLIRALAKALDEEATDPSRGTRLKDEWG